MSEGELKGMKRSAMKKLKKSKGGKMIVPLKKQFLGHITKDLVIEETRKKINFAEG